MYGKHRVKATDVASVQRDLADGCKLHLCVRQLRHTLSFSFPGGQQQCARAHALLCRLRQHSHLTLGDASASAIRAGLSGRAGSAFLHGGLPTKFAGAAPTSADAQRSTSAPSGANCAVPRGRFQPSTVIACCLMSMTIAVGAAYSMAHAWRVGEAALHPAACTVLGFHPLIKRVRVTEKCRSIASEEPHCAYLAMTPGWDVDVRLLVEYPNFDHLHPADSTRNALDADPTRGGEQWRAVAEPNIHSESFRKVAFERGAVIEGLCAGEVWFNITQTMEYCNARQTSWWAASSTSRAPARAPSSQCHGCPAQRGSHAHSPVLVS